MRTTTVKYQTKPQAAVQYEIVLLSGALVYNPNQSEQIEGKLEWRVYKIEGDQRLPMSNSKEGMECYCGYSDSPSTTAGVDTSDNVTFEDGGAAQVAYNSNTTKQFTIIYGSVTGSVFTQLARLDVPVNVIGKDAAVVASIDFDNNNATLLYNSSKGVYANSAVANVSLLVGGEDKSNTATITIESHGVNAAVTRGVGATAPTIFISDGNKVIPSGTGIISVKATSLKDDNTSSGYITATYTDSFNIKYTATFNVTRSVGRYAVEIIATPTQISYNQTTGVASSSKVVAKINAIDINGKKTDGAKFSDFGAMWYRDLGKDTWTRLDNQYVSELEIEPDFTKKGIEFLFTDGSGDKLDYETVPFSSVTNGGDAFLVNVASMNVAVVLTSISYGTPTGDVTNVVYMTKNNAVLPSGVRYDVPGDDGEKYALATDSDTANNVSYNGWVFNYSYQEGRLKSSLVRVEENSPTSVHIPIDVKYPTDNITRSVMISYSAIQKGPAGRSYKPNTPELYDPKKEYVWNDKQRDFIYYAFNVNDKGEQDDEKGVLSYFQYGVKEYNNNGSVTKPPSAKGGDTNWELVSEYKSIIVNCLFGTNAIIGGFRMSGGVQESVCTSEGERPVVDEDGNIVVDKDGNIVTETYQKPLIVINGNEGVIEFFKKKAGIRIGLDGDGNPCLTGYDTEGKCVWKLGTEVVTDYNNNVDIQIPSGSTTAIWITSGRTVNIAVRGVWKVTNMTNSPIEFTSSSLKGYFDNPLDSSSPGVMNISKSQELAVGETGTFLFSGTVSKTYANESLIPIISDNYSIKIKAMYSNEVKTQSSVVLTKQDNTRI